ncbi:MAG: beta-lactamase family protein [Thioclava marina]|uniref:serine hydrolase domain-containing protein n=1 Tax=Thioclava marina TaxID=1915077 RepID=UPI0019C25421|nr:serine hydrolase domain-containing protein [Thioclava marina]MBC7144947.1 beta-lactamase family protein [Thioclava marina]
MNPVLQRVITLSVSLVFSIHPAIAEENDPSRAVRQVLTEFHQTYGFPGATVAYATEDGTVASFAVGFADVEAGTPMTPESRMLAASIGKTVWGALVLSLETDGVLSRSDLVSTYLGDRPWFARVPNAAEITIGQLGNHTSGLPDHVHMEGVAKELIDLGEEEFDPVDLISFIFDEPPLFEAGSNWAYSDSGYVLLGLAIEAATGRDVFDLAQERFLTPLGLSATSPSLERRIDGLAVGYTNDANPFGLAPRTMDEAGRLTWNPVVEWTGGGFASTSSDLAVWGRALFAGNAMAFPYLENLLDGVPVHSDIPDVLYGTGVAVYQTSPYGPVYGHGGWIPGYVSSLRHYADHGVTIAFQINTDFGAADESSDLVSALESALADAILGARD